MKVTDKKNIKKWIDAWDKAGVSLNEIKLNELRSHDYYQKNKALLNEMLTYAFENRTIRYTSGLVEQQQLFMKYYKLKMNHE